MIPEMNKIHQGDSLEELKKFDSNFFDSAVCDPPYELGFMGKSWDSTGIAYNVRMWSEVRRVMKPGAYLLAFGGTRTYHRMACAIEDAGFEIRDQIQWLYGSGFPKSKNIGDGWGTALKPANEPICLARKPLSEPTVAANVLKWGTGALNIDGCRVEIASGERRVIDSRSGKGYGSQQCAHAGRESGKFKSHDQGRWPANVIHDGSPEVLEAFPQAPGQLADASTNPARRKTQNCYGELRAGRAGEPSADSENCGVVGFKMRPRQRRLDSGSAARFFYCAKTSKKERGLGNVHPTVKPLALMRYLCRLVTPPDGIVLDQFAGSGSTLIAAEMEGFRWMGIEKMPEYVKIAEARIASARKGAK